MAITYAPVSFAHGSTTWDADTGKTLRVVVNHNTNVVETHVAGDLQTTDVAVTNQTVEVLVDLAEFTPSALPTLADEQNIVLTLKLSDGTTTTETLYRCKYAGLTTQEQGRDGASASAVITNSSITTASGASVRSIVVLPFTFSTTVLKPIKLY